MFKKIVCGIFHLLLDKKLYNSAEKRQLFGVDFSYFQDCFNGICNHALVICPGSYTNQKGLFRSLYGNKFCNAFELCNCNNSTDIGEMGDYLQYFFLGFFLEFMRAITRQNKNKINHLCTRID